MSVVSGSPDRSENGSFPFWRASITPVLSRDQLFAGLLIVASANGLAARALFNINNSGLLQGVFDTFGISLIVWGGWASACYLVLRDNRPQPATKLNLIVACIILVLVIFPGPYPSWAVVFALSVYVFWTSLPGSKQRQSALIFLALTAPMFWGPLFLNIAGKPLLQIDAVLVGNLIGTEHVGNMVKFASGDLYMQIWPACSSFHNISQAAVAWVTLSQGLGRQWTVYDAAWCGLAGLSALAVNVGRLSLMGLYPQHFDQLHGSPGYEIAGLLTLVAILVVCIIGLRRELFHQP